jgi:hypothetical protein
MSQQRRGLFQEFNVFALQYPEAGGQVDHGGLHGADFISGTKINYCNTG